MAEIHDDEAKDQSAASSIHQRFRSRDTGYGHLRFDDINIDNPLRGIDLKPAVEHFAKTNNLEDLTDVLLRGAYVAEDPDNYTKVEGLTPKDLAALKREYEEKNPFRILAKLPKQLRTIIITCSMAAMTQGWDQVCISAANQYWPPDLGLNLDRQRDVWLFGFINACTFLFASLIGAWFSDPLNEYLSGRRPAIFVAGLFSFFPAIGSGACRNWQQLLICRILLGIGLGCKAAVVPVYAAETAPTNIRGGVLINWNLCVATGGVIGSSFNLALFDILRSNEVTWRLQLSVAALPAIPMLFLIYVCPESPRFLIKRGKWRAAYESLIALTETEVQAARELYVIHIQTELTRIKWYGGDDKQEYVNKLFSPELDSTATSNNFKAPKFLLNQHVGTYLKRLANLFTIPRIRRATTASAVVMISQQLCGINIMSFYSGTILPAPDRHDPESVRNSNRNALWIGWGVYFIAAVMAIPAFMTIDKWGRRTLCLLTTPGLGLCMFAAGFCFTLEAGSTPYLATLFFFIFLFSALYPPGLGVVPYTYSAEVFPTVNREAGMSLAVFVNLFGGGILSLFVPFLQHSLGSLGLFELFAGLNLLAFILMFFFLYETKQERLERLDAIFDVKCTDHFRYQTRHVLPWFFRKVFRRA
ncbi:galactose-proton symport, partial [Ampelomyces quisqualis]